MNICNVVFVALAAGLCACTDGQFGGSAERARSGAEKEEAVAEDLGMESDSEEEAADEPVMVSGAFLTCIEDSEIPAEGERVGVGCVVMDGADKVQIDGYDQVEWALLSVFNLEVPATFSKAGTDGKYHVTTAVLVAGVSTFKVRVRIVKGERSAELFSSIRTTGNAQSGEAEISELGQSEDFQVGDDNFDAKTNRGCNARLDTVALKGHGLMVPFKVTSAKSTVAVSLLDLCGISTQMNRIVIASATGTISEGTLVPYAASYEAAGMELPAGDYHLKILSLKSKGGDRDDFVVGRIVFTKSGEVELGTPVPLMDF